MACVGCGKPLKREVMCKSCAGKPWHKIDMSLEQYALIYFKKKEREDNKLLSGKYWPEGMGREEDEESGNLTEITEEDRADIKKGMIASINDVTFNKAYWQKIHLKNNHIYKKKRLRRLNYERSEEDNIRGVQYPKCTNMKRTCRICNTRKPLDLKHFYWRRYCSHINIDEANDFEKKMFLGSVCRECFEKQKSALKELKKLKINIGGFHHYNTYSHQEKLAFLSAGRILTEIKNLKRMVKNESNHANVHGKQRPYEENFKGRVSA